MFCVMRLIKIIVNRRGYLLHCCRPIRRPYNTFFAAWDGPIGPTLKPIIGYISTSSSALITGFISYLYYVSSPVLFIRRLHRGLADAEFVT